MWASAYHERMKWSLTVVDLFAGAGGATQGLVDAGWEVLAAVENDCDAAETYRMNHPGVVLREDDIENVDPRNLRRDLKLRPGALGLLKACPPCQGYSSLGAGDPDDPRNDLVDEVWRFVQEFKPQAILLENVPGLRSDPRLTRLLRRIRAVGYGVRLYVVNASDFGVPQRRRRLIVLAVKGKKTAQLPDRIEDKLPEAFDRGPVGAGKAFALAGAVGSRGDALHQSRPHSELVQRRIKAIPVGGSRFDLPDGLTLDCHNATGRSASAAYGRISATDVAPTMTTRCTTPACGRFIHPVEDRAITLREAALLQTFPLNYVFHGGPTKVERQIGNAVPVKMAEGLGRALTSIVQSKVR